MTANTRPPFPWLWFFFWLIVFAPIAFLIVLIRAPEVIIYPIIILFIFAVIGGLASAL